MDESEMPNEATKKAIDRYRATKKGKAAQRRAQKNYAETEKGATARKRASEKFESENVETRREYKRKKQAEYRAKRKQQPTATHNSETTGQDSSNQSSAQLQGNDIAKLTVSFPIGSLVQTSTGQVGRVAAIYYIVEFEDGSTQNLPDAELAQYNSEE